MSLFQRACEQCGKEIEATDYKCPHCGHEWERMEIRQPKKYIWFPQKDITAYELAICVPLFEVHDFLAFEEMVEVLPSEAKRHFKENPPT